MKNKGVILSIIFILCAGIFVTNYTRRLVSSGASFEISKEAQTSTGSAAGLPEMAAAQEEPGAAAEPVKAAEDGALSAPAVMEDRAAIENQRAKAAPALLSEEEGVPVLEAASSAPAVISPLTGSVETAEKNKSATSFTSDDYRKKLQDIDAQIKKMKESGVEPNTDSYKNMADFEYRIWDKELNTVYQDILSKMEAEEAEVFSADEREWMKLRDQTAHKAISRYNGGTMESLEYTASMAVSTRTRVYELLENYGGYLDSVK